MGSSYRTVISRALLNLDAMLDKARVIHRVDTDCDSKQATPENVTDVTAEMRGPSLQVRTGS